MFVSLSLLIVLVVGLCSHSLAQETSTTVVNWLSTVYLDDVTSATLTNADKNVLVSTTATTFSLPASAVAFESQGTAAHGDGKTTYQIAVNLRTKVALGDTTYTSAGALYNATTAALTDAVNSGAYESLLTTNAKAASASDLTGASAYDTGYSQYTAAEPINKDENLDLTEGGTAIIVICALVMFFVVLYMGWTTTHAKKEEHYGKPNSPKGYAISEDEV